MIVFRSILILIFIPFIAQSLDSLNDRINHLIKNDAAAKRLNIGIQIKDLKTEAVLYKLNPFQRMIPASTTKSFTTYAALEYLGANFTYSTIISFNKDLITANRELADDLYIIFSGDPSLSKLELANLIASIKINKIRGNIIIDDSAFDQSYQADGKSWDDNKFCYAAPTSAIVIDKNCFYLNLSPGKNPDDIAQVNGDSFSQINNNIITKADSSCSPELLAHPNNSYDLTGCLDSDSATIPLKIAYQDPRLMIKSLIAQILETQNIKYSGNIFFDKVNSSKITKIAEHKSAPLLELVTKMHKISDNIAADNFTKTIGMNYFKTQGNFKNGTKAIKEITGTQDIKIFDGSGASRYNLIAPDQLVDLYILAFKNKKIWPYFYNSLPDTSADEYLATRFTNPALSNKLHAKTGSMSGISNLVGYIEKDNGQILVFAIMVNGATDIKDAHKIIEKILLEMLY